jgi:hypothetical protein
MMAQLDVCTGECLVRALLFMIGFLLGGATVWEMSR